MAGLHSCCTCNTQANSQYVPDQQAEQRLSSLVRRGAGSCKSGVVHSPVHSAPPQSAHTCACYAVFDLLQTERLERLAPHINWPHYAFGDGWRVVEPYGTFFRSWSVVGEHGACMGHQQCSCMARDACCASRKPCSKPRLRPCVVCCRWRCWRRCRWAGRCKGQPAAARGPSGPQPQLPEACWCTRWGPRRHPLRTSRTTMHPASR